jgi:hypothetical protein
LTSLTLPDVTIDLLQHLSAAPFWDRLITLDLCLPMQTSEALSILRDRLPQSLRELRLYARHSPGDYSAAESLFQRLSGVPLRKLHLQWIPLAALPLSRLLDGTNEWELRELSLSGCQMSREHADMVARSPGVRNLLTLSLCEDGFDHTAAQTLFSTNPLRSLVRLDLRGTRIGTAGALALARAEGWNRVRSLNLTGAWLQSEGLRALLASPNLQPLNWLSVGETGLRDEPALDIAPDVAAEITRLPHLAALQLQGPQFHPRIKQILSESDTLAWTSIFCWEDRDVAADRASRAPQRWPPVDEVHQHWE